MAILIPAVIDNVLDSLEAELARFRDPMNNPPAAGRPTPAAEIELPVCANDDLPDSVTHFVIAAYRAC